MKRWHFSPRSNWKPAETSSNCDACGRESLTGELTNAKIASWEVNICKRCVSQDASQDYTEVLTILAEPERNFQEALRLIKEAQELDQELGKQ